MTSPLELRASPPCAICGDTRSQSTRFGSAIVCCVNCAFVTTRSDGLHDLDLYDESYYHGGGYEEYFLPGPRRFEASRRLAWLAGRASFKNLLEVGSAGGFFIEAATAAGIDACGIDISDVAVNYAQKSLGVNVTKARLESMHDDSRWDAIAAFHVLEHVDNPRGFVEAVLTALKPGGVFAVEVPNIASRAAERDRANWEALQPEFHRWHFSPATLTRLLRDSGFTDIQYDTVVFRYYMPTRYRRRRARHYALPDWKATGSPRLVQPSKGDLLRLTARRPSTVGEMNDY